MAYSVNDRVNAFLLEWAMRESLMKLYDDAENIPRHRKEILHNYQLTEEDVKKYQEKS